MKKISLIILSLVLSSALVAQEENPIATIRETPGLCSIFHYWGFIGDSLCSGEFEYTKPDGSKGYWDCYEYSWGMRMCRLMGVEGEVFSKGGETAKGWIEHFWDSSNNKQGVCARNNPKQAYIIALGVNDSNPKRIEGGYLTGNFETDIDFLDYNRNAPSYVGCYAGIIQRLQEMQPQAKIFLVTIPRSSDRYTKYNEVIRRMAETFKNVWLLDIARYASEIYENELKPDFFLGGHMNPAGYEYTAWEFMTYIDWIIRHDMDAFKDIAFMLPSAPQRN